MRLEIELKPVREKRRNNPESSTLDAVSFLKWSRAGMTQERWPYEPEVFSPFFSPPQ